MPYAALVALIWFLDRCSKLWVLRSIPLWSSQPLLGRYLQLTHVHNTGAAFGLLHNQVPLLSLVSLGQLLAIYIFRRQITAMGTPGKLGAALVVAGGLGNLYDRLFLGFVVDFLELPWWPVFNLADSAIVCGVGLLLLGVWRLDRRESDARS